MMKKYQKPEVKYISLVAKEAIAADVTDPAVIRDDIIDGEMGVDSDIWD